MATQVVITLAPKQYNLLRDELAQLQGDLALRAERAPDPETRRVLADREQQVYFLQQEING